MEKLKFILLAFIWMGILLPMGDVFAVEQLDAVYEVPSADAQDNELSEEESSEDEEESNLGYLRMCILYSVECRCLHFAAIPIFRQFHSFCIDLPPRQ